MKVPLNEPKETFTANFQDAVQWRRDLHRNPQPAWLEFYATGFVAEKLSGWGYDLLLGHDIISAPKRLVLPDPETMQAEYERAIRAGIKEEFIAPAKGGFTGVVGILRGALPGPTVGFRFDIDALEITESSDSTHRPAAEGFASAVPSYAHMCGHDVHMATGLLLARYFAESRARLRGTVKLLFQPNEEDLEGASAMVDAGLLDDVDYLLGAHVGIALNELGKVAMNVHSFLALSRFEVTYTGRASHSALNPNLGKNALLGACAAVTNLHAIARHGGGASRVNVGFLQAGKTWNIIPDRAYIRMETRGYSNEINDYMVRRSREILEGAAKMYDLGLEIKPGATAISARNSLEMIELGTRIAQDLPSVREVVPESPFNASEDVTLMMERVQEKGGKALFLLLGTPVFGGHHSATFDVNENVIRIGAELLAAIHGEVSQEIARH